MAHALLQTVAGTTYADYKAWELKPGERYELIHGEAYAMSAPSTVHQLILADMMRQITAFLFGKRCRAIPAPYDVRLFPEKDESDDTVVQPDISVICDGEKLGKEGCLGAPDFVVEILSPSNTHAEMSRKFHLYRKAGVREYWVVNGEDRTVVVHLFEGDAIISRIYREKETVASAAVEGLSVELAPVFAG